MSIPPLPSVDWKLEFESGPTIPYHLINRLDGFFRDLILKISSTSKEFQGELEKVKVFDKKNGISQNLQKSDEELVWIAISAVLSRNN